MDQALLDRILRSPKLPTLPAIAVRILALMQDENLSMHELASTIENDQAIAARVLRTINSSFYGLRRPCANIEQAVIMLGLSAVKTLALSFSLVSTLRSRSEDDFDHMAYWRRSIYSAVAARLVASEARLPCADEAFLGALLQDIGMMAMYQTLGEAYVAIVNSAPEHRDLSQLELVELEVQHADVGAMLAQRWNLPPELTISIKYHEQPTAAPVDYAAQVRAIGLANLACDVLMARQPGPAARRFHACAERWFGVNREACDELLGRIANAAQEVSSLFILDIGESANAKAILARAGKQLALIDEQADMGEREDAPIGRLVSDSRETDPLTGVLTRRAMLTGVLDILDRPSTAGITAIALEIDGFAQIVQSVEQADADALLVETASTLGQYFGPLASIARWEGSLFIILAPGVSEEAAIAVTERLRQSLHRQVDAWFPKDQSRAPGWSAGVSSLDGPARANPRAGIGVIGDAIRALQEGRRSAGDQTHTPRQRIAA